MTEFEWGTAAQWAGVIAALAIATFGAMRQRGDKAIGEIKSTVDRMQASVDRSMAELRHDFTASMNDLRDDDARQFERIDQLEADVRAVEVEMKHLPSRNEFHKLDVKITEIGATITSRFEALADKMDTVIEQNSRAHDRLAEREDRLREQQR